MYIYSPFNSFMDILNSNCKRDCFVIQLRAPCTTLIPAPPYFLLLNMCVDMGLMCKNIMETLIYTESRIVQFTKIYLRWRHHWDMIGMATLKGLFTYNNIGTKGYTKVTVAPPIRKTSLCQRSLYLISTVLEGHTCKPRTSYITSNVT